MSVIITILIYSERGTHSDVYGLASLHTSLTLKGIRAVMIRQRLSEPPPSTVSIASTTEPFESVSLN